MLPPGPAHFIDQMRPAGLRASIIIPHAMTMFSLHVLRALIMGAYRAPELVWITGPCCLLVLVRR
jgi:hypothetical protein